VIIDRGAIVASGTVPELLGSVGGVSRRVAIVLAEAWPDGRAVPAGMELDESRRAIAAAVTDLGEELAVVLGGLAAAGARVVDVKLAGATLQDAFIALTGRELRE
jgi:ABC-2 type transport system ATP-binding protein